MPKVLSITELFLPHCTSSFAAYRLIPLDEEPEPTAGILPAVHETSTPLTTGKIPADRAASGLGDGSTAGKTPVDVPSEPHKTEVLPVFTAGKIPAVGGQNASSTAGILPADILDQPSQKEARGERKQRNKQRKVNRDRTYDTIALQNARQKKSEKTNTIRSEESPTTQSDLPASSATSPDRQAPGERTGVRLYPPSAHALPAGGETAEDAARYQRLLALQSELAQLKKTPSMQLLARQRIPRLEAEIQQLATSLQGSV